MKNMITKTLKRKADFKRTLLGIIILILSACSTSKEITNKNDIDSYSVKHIPNNEHYYEGNIIVEVFDLNNQELIGALVTILSDGKKLSELELKTTSMGVFYKEEKNITVLVSMNGYEDVKTSSITISTDKACFITVRLSEK